MGWLLLAGAVLAGVGVYAGACWLAPFRPCRLCKGTAWRQALLRGEKPCWWCKGVGQRLRWGRRVYNHLAVLHRSGQPTQRRFGGTP